MSSRASSWWRRRRRVADDGLGDGLHPPQGVEVRDADGAWHAVQTAYVGTTEHGVQVFEVVDVPRWAIVVQVRAATLPGMTAVNVPLGPP